MKNKFQKFLDCFLFDTSRRKLPYILLAIFFLVAGYATYYIHANADQLVYSYENALLVGPDGKTLESSATGSAPGAAGSKATSGKKSGANGSSTSSGSSAAGGSGTSGSGTESALAYVAFYSDNQSDTDEEDARHLAVVNDILATDANPVFHAGDLMEDGTADSLNRFNNVAGGMLASRTFYGALGNNDRNGGDTSTPSPLYLANFSFPGNERWYSVNVGNLHLVVLDSAFASTSPTQLAWLAGDLASAESQSRITGVVFHHPSFVSTVESYLINNYADFVVDGHTHGYAKSISNGIYYFTLPGGGSLGYCTAGIYTTQVKFNCYNSSNGLIDSTTFNAR